MRHTAQPSGKRAQKDNKQEFGKQYTDLIEKAHAGHGRLDVRVLLGLDVDHARHEHIRKRRLDQQPIVGGAPLARREALHEIEKSLALLGRARVRVCVHKQWQQ